jgi:hypothetical protein
MRIRLIAALALLLASVPAAPRQAPAAEAGWICTAYCELINAICQAGAVPTGDAEPCLHLYRGCRAGCEAE